MISVLRTVCSSARSYLPGTDKEQSPWATGHKGRRLIGSLKVDCPLTLPQTTLLSTSYSYFFSLLKMQNQVLAMTNSAAMNIGVHVSLSDLVFLVCMPRSGIAGSYGSFFMTPAPTPSTSRYNFSSFKLQSSATWLKFCLDFELFAIVFSPLLMSNLLYTSSTVFFSIELTLSRCSKTVNLIKFPDPCPLPFKLWNKF